MPTETKWDSKKPRRTGVSSSTEWIERTGAKQPTQREADPAPQGLPTSDLHAPGGDDLAQLIAERERLAAEAAETAAKIASIGELKAEQARRQQQAAIEAEYTQQAAAIRERLAALPAHCKELYQRRLALAEEISALGLEQANLNRELDQLQAATKRLAALRQPNRPQRLDSLSSLAGVDWSSLWAELGGYNPELAVTPDITDDPTAAAVLRLTSSHPVTGGYRIPYNPHRSVRG